MGKTVRDVMSGNPSAVDAGKPVADAAKVMKDEDIGLAPIVEGDKLVGALTDRDIAVRVVAEGRDPESTRVSEVASKDLVTVDPQQNLDDALSLMAQHQVRRLPVVEEDGRLVGVVSQADVAKSVGHSDTGRMVEEISQT